MNKKAIIWTVTIIIVLSVIFIIYKLVDNRNKERLENANTQNLVKISEASDEPVTDECLEEWNDYNEYVSEKIQEASNNIAEDNTHYLLKDILGYIEVYYLDEDDQEYLYKKTTIPTTYLSEEDIDSLKKGIEVVGIKELNKILEDFE